jgi:predicted deacylase
MIAKPFKFADELIEPGTKKTILFPAPNLNTQVKVDIPVHVFHGKMPGPRLFILSGIHGDELSGIEILRRVHEKIHPKRLAGTLITVPVVNIHGIMMQTRYLSDRRDLNRSFPGRKNGTLAARLAYGVMNQVVKLCDYGIDLHTGAVGHINMPQLRVDFSVPGSKAFAQHFGSPVILDSRQRNGSLREAASRLGIPVIVYEGGEALRFNELCIRSGVRGILHAMSYLNMLKIKEKTVISKAVITNTSRWLRAPASGFVEPVPDLIATPVKKGQLLGQVHDPFLIHPSIDILAPFEGIVIGQAMRAMATEGDALFHIASFKKMDGVRAYIDDYREAIIL